MLFIVIILLLFLYYLDNDLGASNTKDKDRVDLQIEAESIPMDSKPTNEKTRKRRLYEASGLIIEPYHKKPKMVKSTLLPLSDERRTNFPNSLKKAQQHNFLWTSDLTFNRQSGDVPMWVDWNSRHGPREESMQKVWYLKQMNESPTSTSVVAETLKRSQKVAEECNKYNISVTYDLAIAKVAMQLQAEEKPTYDNVFIHLGPFHITCAFFFYAWKVPGRIGLSTYSK